MAEFKLYDAQSKKEIPLENRPDLEGEIMQDKVQFDLDAVVPMEKDGERRLVQPHAVKSGISLGWKIETPSRSVMMDEVDAYKEKHGGWGTFAVGASGFADEFLLGIPEIAHQYAADPINFARREYLKEQYPYANPTGQIGGFIGSMLMGGPAALLGRAGMKVGVGAERAMMGVLGSSKPFASIMGRGAKYTAEGLVGAAPYSATEQWFGDGESAGESLAWGGGLGAIMGAGAGMGKIAGFGKDYLKSALNRKDASKSAVTKMTNLLVEKPRDVIEYYVENNARLRNGLEEAGEEFAPRVARAFEDSKFRAKDIEGELAENAYKNVSLANDPIPKVITDIEDIAPELGVLRREADAAAVGLQQEGIGLKQTIKDVGDIKIQKPVQRFEEISEDIIGAAKVESNNLSRLSTESHEILGAAEGTIGSGPILKSIEDKYKGMTLPASKGPRIALDETDVNKLKGMYQKIKRVGDGENITYKDSKELMTQLDGMTDYNDFGFKRDTRFNKALKGIRTSIDDQLKGKKGYEGIPGYKEKMLELSSRTGRFVKFQDEFFDKLGVKTSVIKGLNKPENFAKRTLLNEYSDSLIGSGAVPEGITSKIDEFEALAAKYDLDTAEQALLKKAMKQRGLDLEVRAKTLAADTKGINKQIAERIDYSKREHAKLTADRQRELIDIKTERFALNERNKSAREELQIMAPLQNSKLSISDFRYKNPKDNNKRAYSYLENNIPGFENATRKAKDIAMIDAMMMKSINGSRKVNSLAGIFGAIGSMFRKNIAGIGGGAAGFVTGGPIGMGFGAGAGHLLDANGGSFLRAVIDLQMGRAKPFIRMEGHIKKTYDKIDDIGNAYKTKKKLSTKIKEKVTRSKGYMIFRLIDAQGGNEREKFLDTHDKLESMISSPELMIDKVDEIVEDLNLVEMPQIAAVVARKLTQMVTYGYETMPKPASPLMPKEREYWEPSSLELSQWYDRLAVMDDPFVAIDAMIDSTLTTPEVDAFKTIYPDIYAATQAKVLEVFIDDDGQDLSYDQSLAASLFLGMNLNTSLNPSNIANNQAAYQVADEGQEEAAQKPRQVSGSRTNVKALTTKAQRLATV